MGQRKFTIQKSVFDAALDRLIELYQNGDRLVVSFSGGKDSGVCVELCVIAARMTGRLPVEVLTRDEEIMFPGTFEYCERMAARTDEISFHWIYACQPVINVCNRECPYFWVFDPELPPEKWVRQPPEYAYRIPCLNIRGMTTNENFPPAPGKTLYSVLGLRAGESRIRQLAVFRTGGHITAPNEFGTANCRPIYDWNDGDIWKAIGDNKWDYNDAYDVMHRLGVSRTQLRIAPPTLRSEAIRQLPLAARAWPYWFEKVCERLPGIRAAAHYGPRAVEPQRRQGETWQQCFERTCLKDAPAWIVERATMARDKLVKMHGHHSSAPLPETRRCLSCVTGTGSWKGLAEAMYMGDPFSLKVRYLPYVEPEFFRPGSGRWGGKPGF